MLVREILTEMPAIASRTVHNTVANPNGALGTTLTPVIPPGQFTAAVYPFPAPNPQNKGRYPTATQLALAIRDAEAQNGKITWANTRDRAAAPDKFLAFALTKWRNERNKQFIIGKYLHDTTLVQNAHGNAATNYGHPKRFDANDLGPELGYKNTHGNSQQSATQLGDQAPELVNLKPGDLLTLTQAYTPAAVVADLTAKLGARSPLVALAKQTAAGQKQLSIDTTGINVNSLNKNFTEILHPMALISSAYVGSAPPYDFTGATFTYTNSSGAVSDAIVDLKNGQTVWVSSKLGTGTPTAIGTEFNKLITNLPANVKRKYTKEIQLLMYIVESSFFAVPGNIGPLRVPVQLGLMTQAEAEFIADVLGKDKPTRETQASALPVDTPPRLKQILDAQPNNLRRGKKSYFMLMRHFMLAAANELNNSPEMGNLLKAALDNNFITMSTTASGKDKTETLSFTCKIFDTDDRKVKLVVDTAYNYDHAKNKLQFTIQ